MSLKQLANIRIGIVNVVFNGVDLGHTLDGVQLTYNRTFQPLMVDKYTAPIDEALTGSELTIKMKFAEPVLELFQRIYPEGNYSIGSAGSRAGIGADSGTLLRQYSYQLTLHPIKNAANDFSEDVVIYNAVNKGNIVLDYTVKNQRVVEATFEALTSESQPNGQRLGHIGLTNIS